MAGLFDYATETPEEKAAKAAAAGSAPGGAPGTTNATAAGTNATNTLPSAVTSVPVIGPALGGATSVQTVDLNPVHAAQNAAFGLGAKVGDERDAFQGTKVPTLERGPMDETRNQQEDALRSLSAAANGTVPSAADLQAKQSAGTAAANVLGAARALGGRSAGGVGRAATLGESDILAKAGADAAARRAAEQSDARNQLTAALGGVRTQDIGAAGQNLSAETTNNAQNLAAKNALLDAQLKAYGIGTGAATGGAEAAGAAAGAQNKAKGGFLDTVGGYLGL